MAQPVAELIRSLEKAVNTAFFRAGLKTGDLYGGPIKHVSLPWQGPPLKSQDMLLGVPLEDYLLTPIPVNTTQVHSWWVSTLRGLYNDPAKIVDSRGEYKDIRRIFGEPYGGQHKFRFSMPAGFPRIEDAYAGVTFSLEVADAIMNSLPWLATRSENDYYVTSPDGLDIGVKAGRPAIESGWDADCSGMVWDFLAMPRGRISTICMFEPVDKLRSLLHENAKAFKEFQGVDYALQALRLLYRRGQRCCILHTAVAVGREQPDYFAKEKALKQAVETMARVNISDRSKVAMLYSQLVPAVFSESGFSAKIYNLAKVAPYTLADSTVNRINNRIALELAKLPIHLQEKP